jgi:hypothetical protein
LEWFVEIGVVRKPTDEFMSGIARLQPSKLEFELLHRFGDRFAFLLLPVLEFARIIGQISSPFLSCRVSAIQRNINRSLLVIYQHTFNNKVRKPE